MLNAKIVRAWFEKKLGSSQEHLFAVTAAKEAALAFGILAKNIFSFDQGIGGRYSIWSQVGLSLALNLGFVGFREFLAGASAMDAHFAHTPFNANIPVLMGLISVWNINYLHKPSLAIIPYTDLLTDFPAYIQQLEMESNGKKSQVYSHTAPIIWGGVGCNAQHAYMQALHQGNLDLTVDFISVIQHQYLHSELDSLFQEQEKLLLASALSQAEALALGHESSDLKACPGDQMSTHILLETLSPRALGSLIACYEHKVFVQGIIWQINSFDQWGVELGKSIGKLKLKALSENTQSQDPLLNYIKEHKSWNS